MKLLILLFLISCNDKPTASAVCKTVDEIGTCDIEGRCSVKFTDGAFISTAMRPMVGMQMCEYKITGMWWRKE